MNKKFPKLLLSVCAIALLLTVAACGGGSQVSQGNDKKGTGQSSDSVDASGKFNPPIEITTVRSTSPAWVFPDGDSIDNNVWYRDFDKELGIKLKNIWSVPTGQFNQKLNVTLASGELPVLIPVQPEQMKKLVDDNQVEDLTEAYKKYASPLAKDILNQDGGLSLKSSTFQGKLMAFPRTGAPINSATILWIRTDWRQKLNLPEPKTVDDVLAIADAFTKRDPDGNGKNDTFGLAIHKDLFNTSVANLEGFFNSYHAYPNIWIKDSQGKLQYGSIQPEMKTVLQKLQDLYKAGEIDKEFGVKDANKVDESIAAGKIGVMYGWPANSLVQKYRDADPKADWQAFALLSADDKPAKPQIGLGIQNYYVIKKGFKHPEALVMMFNRYFEKLYGKTAEPLVYARSKDGVIKSENWAPVDPRPYRKNLDAYLNVTASLKTKDTSKLNPEELDYYERIVKFMAGDNKNFGYARVFGEKGSFSIVDFYMKEKRLLSDEFITSATPTMIQKKSSLEKLQLTTFTKIILNDAPVSEFDKFVSDWKKLGGDQITKEVNDWYATSK